MSKQSLFALKLDFADVNAPLATDLKNENYKVLEVTQVQS